MVFDPNNPKNTLLQIEVIFNIESTIYIISFRLNNLVLIFISKKLLMKYHDKISVTFFEFVRRMGDLIIFLILFLPNTSPLVSLELLKPLATLRVINTSPI